MPELLVVGEPETFTCNGARIRDRVEPPLRAWMRLQKIPHPGGQIPVERVNCNLALACASCHKLARENLQVHLRLWPEHGQIGAPGNPRREERERSTPQPRRMERAGGSGQQDDGRHGGQDQVPAAPHRLGHGAAQREAQQRRDRGGQHEQARVPDSAGAARCEDRKPHQCQRGGERDGLKRSGEPGVKPGQVSQSGVAGPAQVRLEAFTYACAVCDGDHPGRERCRRDRGRERERPQPLPFHPQHSRALDQDQHPAEVVRVHQQRVGGGERDEPAFSAFFEPHHKEQQRHEPQQKQQAIHAYVSGVIRLIAVHRNQRQRERARGRGKAEPAKEGQERNQSRHREPERKQAQPYERSSTQTGPRLQQDVEERRMHQVVSDGGHQRAPAKPGRGDAEDLVGIEAESAQVPDPNPDVYDKQRC